MAVVTIPKKLTKGDDLVVLPRKEYEALLRVKTSTISRSNIIIDKHSTIEARLKEAEEDIKAGRVSRTFTSVKELMADLNTGGERKKLRKLVNASS